MEMKVEINNENKAKFFALYWGQEIFRYRNVDKISPQAINIHVDHYTLNPTVVFEFGYIVLKHLSSISDEDAIEVAKINTSIDWNNGLEPSVWINSFGYKVVSNGTGLIQRYGQTLICEPYLSLHQFQLLISKGYALPWMGLSVEEMVEAGWIKLTTYKQKEL